MTSFLVRCLRANIEHLQSDTLPVAQLDLSRIIPRYKHSQTRLLLIDFEGTLWIRDPALLVKGIFNPPAETIQVLNKLADDPRNEVWLLSGLQVKGALEKVAEAAPKIGIV